MRPELGDDGVLALEFLADLLLHKSPPYLYEVWNLLLSPQGSSGLRHAQGSYPRLQNRPVSFKLLRVAAVGMGYKSSESNGANPAGGDAMVTFENAPSTADTPRIAHKESGRASA